MLSSFCVRLTGSLVGNAFVNHCLQCKTFEGTRQNFTGPAENPVRAPDFCKSLSSEHWANVFSGIQTGVTKRELTVESCGLGNAFPN